MKIADIHAHPQLKVSLFDHDICKKHKSTGMLNPLGMRCDIPTALNNNVKIMVNSTYLPEKKIFEQLKLLDCAASKINKKLHKIITKGKPIDVTLGFIDQFNKSVEKCKEYKKRVKIIKTYSELSQIKTLIKRHDLVILHAIEGSHSLGNDVSNVDKLKKKGVFSINLAHFYPNSFVYPVSGFPEHFQWLGLNPPTKLDKGLTKLGEKLVEKMLDENIIIDICHCTKPAIKSIIKKAKEHRKPVIASHVGAYDINKKDYNLTRKEIEMIRETGGLIGVIFMNYWLRKQNIFDNIFSDKGLDAIVKTICHIKEIHGSTKHIAIGTDFDGFTDPPNDIHDYGDLSKLKKKLENTKGIDSEDIKNIFFNNFINLLSRIG